MRHSSLIGMIMQMARREGLMPDLSLLDRRRSPKGHAWSGRRHKLKRSHQDHQRNVSPSRRHG